MRLSPFCDQIIVAGSIRREKDLVGDIELLAIPKYSVQSTPYSLFQENINLLEQEVERLISSHFLDFRVKSDGTVADGHKVKLLQLSTGIPVDLFMTTQQAWFNSLVCRTGGKRSNEQIAGMALMKGWNWKMGGPGFHNPTTNTWHVVTSEEAVFNFVGLPYIPPNQRP
jgi:DNA polymerase/3'-5' exonuclease PolX